MTLFVNRGDRNRRLWTWMSQLIVVLLGFGVMQAQAGSLFKGGEDTAECDKYIPPIASGYGANGSHRWAVETMRNPLRRRSKVSVFLPEDVAGKAPVIFFSHAFGASDWEKSYIDFIPHIASLGYIVVYSPYPTFRATVDERYEILWKGFELAVERYGDRMDLSRVGFVGHSFGGGATPAMAYRGIVRNGWGSQGAFMYMMAPWYTYQITDAQMREFPSHVIEVIEIFDKDDVNDHRMAIDLYRSIGLPRENRFFLTVRSVVINGCKVLADHATPSRNNPSLRLKQYAIFRPFDALADYVFNKNRAGREALEGKGKNLPTSEVYRPLGIEADPVPHVPEGNFRFPWNNPKENYRINKEAWK